MITTYTEAFVQQHIDDLRKEAADQRLASKARKLRRRRKLRGSAPADVRPRLAECA